MTPASKAAASAASPGASATRDAERGAAEAEAGGLDAGLPEGHAPHLGNHPLSCGGGLAPGRPAQRERRLSARGHAIRSRGAMLYTRPAARSSARRRPSCTAVSVGLAWPEVGSTAVETTKRPGTPKTRQRAVDHPLPRVRRPCGSCRSGARRPWRSPAPRPAAPSDRRRRTRARARRLRSSQVSSAACARSTERRRPREKRRSMRSRRCPSRSRSLAERQPAVRRRQLLGVVLESVAPGAGSAGRSPGSRIRATLCFQRKAGAKPTVRGRSQEDVAQVGARRYGGGPTCFSRTGSAISRRPSGATDSARNTADSGPERCAALAIGGTTGQKATLASRSAAWVASGLGTKRRRT